MLEVIGRPVRASIIFYFAVASIKVCPKQRCLHALSQDTSDTAAYIRDLC